MTTYAVFPQSAEILLVRFGYLYLPQWLEGPFLAPVVLVSAVWLH